MNLPIMKYFEKHFLQKGLYRYLVGEYILNFCPESKNFYFLENMLVNMYLLIPKFHRSEKNAIGGQKAQCFWYLKRNSAAVDHWLQLRKNLNDALHYDSHRRISLVYSKVQFLSEHTLKLIQGISKVSLIKNHQLYKNRINLGEFIRIFTL